MRSISKRFRRALIVSDCTWQTEPTLQACGTVAIGGEKVNPLTNRFIAEVASQGRGPWDKLGLCGIFANGPRVALWGGTAEQTRASFQHYIRDREGLAKLLPMIWKREG
jgi:hypothetical protein